MADGFESPISVGRAELAACVLVDESRMAKWRLWEDLHGASVGRAVRYDGGLTMAVSPGEWLAVGEAPEGADSVDMTHVRAAFRLTGPGASAVLEHVCALDLSDPMTPDGAAARTLVAGVATEIVRDDVDEKPSYLLLMSRSFARSVWERLAAAGSPSRA